ncbi:cytochrome P450 [Microdochium trichocladiopsis]|uniref:Cytochrome P450 n=1 Tax=Microdochium trichocladiopsis TaxID=1682393 RepID=A0A9P8Y0W9_9PEZI|nr:cytochrome P450 [Microdochium trichocladiopsis]KAH7027167.1 cytochrome P450 [Microdochium trichocladiopsis]
MSVCQSWSVLVCPGLSCTASLLPLYLSSRGDPVRPEGFPALRAHSSVWGKPESVGVPEQRGETWRSSSSLGHTGQQSYCRHGKTWCNLSLGSGICHRITEAADCVIKKILSSQPGKILDIKDVFNCYTGDVISRYVFGQSMGFIDQEGWTPNFATWVKSFLQSAYMMRHNVVARKLAQYIPLMADYMGEDIATVMKQMNVVIPGYIQAALDDPDNGRVFAEVLQNKSLPDQYKDMFHLSGEGFNFLLAGTETTAAILTVITHHLLAQPAIYKRLMQTLGDTSSSTPEWSHLENNPYFWAIVQESLRIMPGVSHRSARIARDEDLHYKNAAGDIVHIIPRGTPIGMSSVINHMDPSLFHDPEAFKPERWLLEDGSPNHKLKNYLLAFGRGSRACISEKLANCEIYTLAVRMASRVIPRATLHEPGNPAEHFKYDHDMIVLQTKNGPISCKISIC